jgi:hypothetical protein
MVLKDFSTVRLLCAKCPPLVASVLISLTFISCNATSPTAPVLPSAPEELTPVASSTPEELAPALAGSAPCPTYNEACQTGRDLVADACPLDGKYKKTGDLKKCQRQAVDSYLNSLSSCFSQSERSSMRHCILSSFPLVDPTSGGTGKDQFHTDE